MTEAEEQPERLKGNVKWFNSTKGFGFITIDGSEDEVFVHQSNIDTTGFRSLREGEDVEFTLVIGDDGKKKAFNVTGPEGAQPLGSNDGPPRGIGFSGRGGMRPYDPGFAAAAAYGAVYQQQQHQQQQQPLAQLGAGRGSPVSPQGFYPPMPPDAYMSYYPMSPASGYSGYPTMYPRGRGGYYPGGKNWVGARPPPPGQPGFSSGLQVVVHNLPWDCTWQQLKDAFSSCGEIDRADVVFDSRGRSRGFGIVRFPSPDMAQMAVDKMNNQAIGGRVVSVRLDRFA